jgi:hypothetical protein
MMRWYTWRMMRCLAVIPGKRMALSSGSVRDWSIWIRLVETLHWVLIFGCWRISVSQSYPVWYIIFVLATPQRSPDDDPAFRQWPTYYESLYMSLNIFVQWQITSARLWKFQAVSECLRNRITTVSQWAHRALIETEIPGCNGAKWETWRQENRRTWKCSSYSRGCPASAFKQCCVRSEIRISSGTWGAGSSTNISLANGNIGLSHRAICTLISSRNFFWYYLPIQRRKCEINEEHSDCSFLPLPCSFMPLGHFMDDWMWLKSTSEMR